MLGEWLVLTRRLPPCESRQVKLLTNHLPCGTEVTIDIEPTAAKVGAAAVSRGDAWRSSRAAHAGLAQTGAFKDTINPG